MRVDRREHVDLPGHEQQVREELRGALVQRCDLRQVRATQGAQAEQLGRRGLLGGEAQPCDVGTACQTQGRRRDLRERGVHVLPGRELAEHPPEIRDGVHARGVAPTPATERVEVVIVGVGGVRRHPRGVTQLAANLLGESRAERAGVDGPGLQEERPVELGATHLQLRQLGQRPAEPLFVDVAELEENLPEVRDRVARADLRGLAVGEEHDGAALVRGEELDGPRELLVHRVKEQMDEWRPCERAARGGRGSVRGEVAHDGQREERV